MIAQPISNVPIIKKAHYTVSLLCLTLLVFVLFPNKIESQCSNINVTTVAGSDGSLIFPIGLASDAEGNVYVGDRLNHRIRKITSDGVVTTFAGMTGMIGNANGIGTAASFNQPWGIATDAQGNVYVADGNNHLIRKITPSGVVTTLAGIAGMPGSSNGIGTSASFNRPTGVATDVIGNVYVADRNNHLIRKISPAGVVTTLAGMAGIPGSSNGLGTSASFFSPWGIATDAGGNVYVADSGNDLIRKISPAGAVTTLAGMAGIPGSSNSIGTSASFNSPTGVISDATGNIYVADQGNHLIRKISPTGVVSTIAGITGASGSMDGSKTEATFRLPSGIAIDGQGNLYVADQGSSLIRKITCQAQTVPTLGQWGLVILGLIVGILGIVSIKTRVKHFTTAL